VKRETLFLKIAIFVIGFPVLALCLFVLPKFPSFYADWLPELAYLRYPIVFFFYVTAIPFFFALYRAFNILTYIGTVPVTPRGLARFVEIESHSACTSLRFLTLFAFYCGNVPSHFEVTIVLPSV